MVSNSEFKSELAPEICTSCLIIQNKAPDSSKPIVFCKGCMYDLLTYAINTKQFGESRQKFSELVQEFLHWQEVTEG